MIGDYRAKPSAGAAFARHGGLFRQVQEKLGFLPNVSRPTPSTWGSFPPFRYVQRFDAGAVGLEQAQREMIAVAVSAHDR